EVSIQPVRTAVDSLLSQRFLLRDPSGRLVMNPGKQGRTNNPERVLPVPARPDLVTLLTERIVRHSLRGEEVFLREEETAQQVGVGRAVLRSALNRMNGAGLVDHVPRRGWRIRTFSEKRMLDYLEVREVLEVRAMDQARSRLDPNDLAHFLALNRPGPEGQARIDNGLHAYWIERAQNSYITEFFAQHGRYHAALFDYATLAGERIEEMALQHCAILDALRDAQWSRARHALREHIRSQCPNVNRLLEYAAQNGVTNPQCECV
ncbi:MAG: GntR family transcriptional regulator, partial [Verrucomicrobia bacterium]|nr:GntR family transcriptional regulator [Verrucomicrobiota bacterium]